MPALNAAFEKKALKKQYGIIFEYYLHFCKQEWLKDWWIRKPEIIRTIAIAFCDFHLMFCA